MMSATMAGSGAGVRQGAAFTCVGDPTLELSVADEDESPHSMSVSMAEDHTAHAQAHEPTGADTVAPGHHGRIAKVAAGGRPNPGASRHNLPPHLQPRPGQPIWSAVEDSVTAGPTGVGSVSGVCSRGTSTGTWCTTTGTTVAFSVGGGHSRRVVTNTGLACSVQRRPALPRATVAVPAATSDRNDQHRLGPSGPVSIAAPAAAAIGTAIGTGTAAAPNRHHRGNKSLFGGGSSRRTAGGGATGDEPNNPATSCFNLQGATHLGGGATGAAVDDGTVGSSAYGRVRGGPPGSTSQVALQSLSAIDCSTTSLARPVPFTSTRMQQKLSNLVAVLESDAAALRNPVSPVGTGTSPEDGHRALRLSRTRAQPCPSGSDRQSTVSRPVLGGRVKRRERVLFYSRHRYQYSVQRV